MYSYRQIQVQYIYIYTSPWISNYIHYKVWDEITYPIPEIQQLHHWISGWIINFIYILLGVRLLIQAGI